MTALEQAEIEAAAKRALAAFGAREQLDKCVEEALEFAVDARHFRDGKISRAKFAEEIAGVIIVATQARMLVGADVFDAALERQLAKLNALLDGAQ